MVVCSANGMHSEVEVIQLYSARNPCGNFRTVGKLLGPQYHVLLLYRQKHPDTELIMQSTAVDDIPVSIAGWDSHNGYPPQN